VIPQVGAGNLGSDVNFGALSEVGLEHHRGPADISIDYRFSYSGALRYSNLNAIGHNLLVSVSRELGRKWKLNFTAFGQDMTLAEYIFQPSNLGRISGAPADFNDVAAAFSVGQFSSSQAASLLTNFPIQAATQSALLGYRVLTYDGTVSLSYTISRRLSVSASSYVTGGRTRIAGQAASSQPNYIMPLTVGGNAGFNLNYIFSPRTTVEFSLIANELSNRYQHSTGGTGLASVGRKMGQHWFLRGYAGASYIGFIHKNNGTPVGRQVIGGGSLGLKTYGSTWLASYDRSAYDSGGFAVGRNTNISGAWSWQRRGSSWRLQNSVGWLQMDGNGFAAIKGWQETAGVARQLGSAFSISATYVHLDTRGTYLGGPIPTLGGPIPTRLKINSVRINFTWSPQIGL
jgi:hypothetical protein